MNILKLIKPVNTYGKKGNPFLNKKKYSVIDGAIMVNPEEIKSALMQINFEG
jgi:hypothetical protein